MSIGMLGAVTGEEFARTFSPACSLARVQVAPRTTYGVARMQQEFGSAGIALRGDGDGGASRSRRAGRARVAAPTIGAAINGETNVRMRDGDYEFEVHGGVTRVEGEAAAIDRVQRASARYLQRPDADYLKPYDPTRTSMSGAKRGATFRRRNARHWLWQLATETETPELEMNDVGRFSTGDGTVVNSRMSIGKLSRVAGFGDYSFVTSTHHEWNFGGEMQVARLTPTFITLPNFWDARWVACSPGDPGRAADARWSVDGKARELAANS